MAVAEFHQVSGKRWEHVLCELAAAAAAAGERCYLWASSEAKAREFDDLLWTFSDRSFVPHALWQGEASCDEPVAVGWRPGNPNGASCLLLGRPASPAEAGTFHRVVDLVLMDDPSALEQARHRFRTFRKAGFSVVTLPSPP